MFTRLKLAAAGLVVAALLIGAAYPAAASAPPPIAGDRISWNYHFPCYDGGGFGGTSVDAYVSYLAPLTGYYQVRLALYRVSDDARLGLDPNPWTGVVGAGRTVSHAWTSFYTSMRGDTYVTAYVWKEVGGSWVLVACESIGCIG